MKIQKRLISLLLVLMIAFGLVGTASAASFKGEIRDGILVKYTGDLYAITAGDFPDTVKVIGASAFKDVPLTSVVVPNRITSIGANAFADCRDLKSITLPNALKTIQEGTFQNCSSLQNIVIPDTVTSIEASAFSNCISLETVKGPTKIVKSVNKPQNPSGITYEAVTGYLTSVGTNAFFNCVRLMVTCMRGSALETYCKDNGIEYTSLQPLIDKITVAAPQYTMVKGGEKTITVTIAPEVSAKEALAWTSSNEQIAPVTQAGVVKGVAPGAVTVTIRSDAYIDGKEGAMDLTKVVVLDPTKSWQKWDGRWYYCYGTSVDSFAVSWTQIGGVWYYFDAYGRMADGWQLIGNTWYYFNTNGVMQTGWRKIDGVWYFFGADGGMRTDWQKIGRL